MIPFVEELIFRAVLQEQAVSSFGGGGEVRLVSKSELGFFSSRGFSGKTQQQADHCVEYHASL